MDIYTRSIIRSSSSNETYMYMTFGVKNTKINVINQAIQRHTQHVYFSW